MAKRVESHRRRNQAVAEAAPQFSKTLMHQGEHLGTVSSHIFIDVSPSHCLNFLPRWI